MSNQHYTINQEIEVTLKLKIKIDKMSDYNHIKPEQIQEHVNDFKKEIVNHIYGNIQGEYCREEVTCGVDDWTYQIEPLLTEIKQD